MSFDTNSGVVCAVTGCKNGQKVLYLWKEEMCDVHDGMKHNDCACLLPFKLHRFPESEEVRREWVTQLKRKCFIPTKNSVVCSIHFIDGHPTEVNPSPTLHLGYGFSVSYLHFEQMDKKREQNRLRQRKRRQLMTEEQQQQVRDQDRFKHQQRRQVLRLEQEELTRDLNRFWQQKRRECVMEEQQFNRDQIRLCPQHRRERMMEEQQQQNQQQQQNEHQQKNADEPPAKREKKQTVKGKGHRKILRSPLPDEVIETVKGNGHRKSLRSPLPDEEIETVKGNGRRESLRSPLPDEDIETVKGNGRRKSLRSPLPDEEIETVKGNGRRKILRLPLPDETIPDPIVEYKKDGYCEGVCRNLMMYRTCQKYCDVILRVIKNNKLYKAHTLVLSAASPFFEELFENPKHRDNRNLVLSLPEYIDCNGLEPILSYMYSGRLVVKLANVISIFKVAWLFKMDDVLNMCQQFCRTYNVPQQAVDVASEHVILQKDKSIRVVRKDAKENTADQSTLVASSTEKVTHSPAINASSTMTVSAPSKTLTIVNQSTKPVHTPTQQPTCIKQPVIQIPTTTTKLIAPAPPKSPLILSNAQLTPQIVGVRSILKPAPPVANMTFLQPTVGAPPFPGIPMIGSTQGVIGGEGIVNPASISGFVPPHTLLFFQQPQQNASQQPPIPVTLATSVTGLVNQPVIVSQSLAETVQPTTTIKTEASQGGDVTMTLPRKPSNFSIPTEVLQQINHAFKVNADAGKSSRVFFIKAPQPIDNVQNLLTALADKTTIVKDSVTVMDTSKLPQEKTQSTTEQPAGEESKLKLDVGDGSNRRMTLADKIARLQASNAETEEMLLKQSNDKSNDADFDGAKPEESTANTDGVEMFIKVEPDFMTTTGSPEQAEDEEEAFVEGYVVRFYRPSYLSDTDEGNCKPSSTTADGKFILTVAMPTHCIATTQIEQEVKYSHPMLYILHALREVTEAVAPFTVLTADVHHEAEHWRAYVSLDDKFVVLERGEVHYLFPRAYAPKPEETERFKHIRGLMDGFGASWDGTEEKTDDINGGMTNLECEYCGYNSSSLSNKARHIYTTHVDQMYKDTDYYKYVCNLCNNFKHRSLKRLYFHKYIEHGWELSDAVRQFRCGLCSKVEVSLTRIKDHHDRMHRDSRDYVCDKCGYAFKTASVLGSHIRYVHVKNFHWRCHHCGKKFKDKSSLGLHMRTHTGEKPFQCEDCSYASAFRGNLKTHMAKRHNKELHNLKPPDAYPRIYTRGRGRGISRRVRPTVKVRKTDSDSLS